MKLKLTAPSPRTFVFSLMLVIFALFVKLVGIPFLKPSFSETAVLWAALAYITLAVQTVAILARPATSAPQSSTIIRIKQDLGIALWCPATWVVVGSLLLLSMLLSTKVSGWVLPNFSSFTIVILAYLLLFLDIVIPKRPTRKAGIAICALVLIALTADSYAFPSGGDIPTRIIFTTRVVKLTSLFIILKDAMGLLSDLIATYGERVAAITRGYNLAILFLGFTFLGLLIIVLISVFMPKIIIDMNPTLQITVDIVSDVGSLLPLFIFVISNIIALRHIGRIPPPAAAANVAEERQRINRLHVKRVIEHFVFFVDLPVLLAVIPLAIIAVHFAVNCTSEGNGVCPTNSTQESLLFISGGIAFLVFANVISGGLVQHKAEEEYPRAPLVHGH